MKAERRHQLQSNSLSHVMDNLPEYGKRYGSQILLGITVLLLIGVVIRWRLGSAEESLRNAALSLDTAREKIDDVRTAPLRVLSQKDAKEGAMYGMAHTAAGDAEAAIAEVFSATDNPRYIADARLLRGDLNWALANIPEPDAKATDKLPKTSLEYLAQAAESYKAVLMESKSPEDALISAHFSMAAVNENQGRWEEARKHYDAIINDVAAGEPFKRRAEELKSRQEKLRVAPLLATAPAVDAIDPAIPSDISGPPKPATTGSTTTASPATTPEPAKAPAGPEKPADPAKLPEPAKAPEPAKTPEPAKPEVPGAEPAKGEPVKPDAPKPDVPKADAPK